MANYFLEEELDLTALEIDDLDMERERLTAKFGNGYGASANVGTTKMHRWRLSSNVLTDHTNYNDLIQGLPTYQYYESFIDRHTGGGDADIFVIEFRGKNYHAAFVNPGFGSGMLTIDMFSVAGVEIEQRRSQGALYNADGSIFDPLSVGELALGQWFDPQFFTVGEELADGADIDAVDWTSRTVDEGVLAPGGTGSTLQDAEQNGLPVTRYDGTDTHRLITMSPVKAALIVMKIREATFTGNDQWFISDETLAFLKSSTGTTKFANQTFGGTYTYRKNGVVFTEANQQAPMEEFGVISVQKTGGLGALGSWGIIGDAAGNVPLADIGDVMLMTSVPSAANMTKLEQFLMRRWNISA